MPKTDTNAHRPAIKLCRILMAVGALAVPALTVRAQSWSADGKTIAVGGATLDVLDAPGVTTANPMLSVIGVSPAAAPCWSPDDKSIFFLGAGNVPMLVNFASKAIKPIGAQPAFPATWSADSSRVAFLQSGHPDGLDLRLAYRDGGNLLRPIRLPFRTPLTGSRSVAWIPHVDNAIVAGGSNGNNDLYLIDQGQVVQLTKSGDVLGFAVSADGSRVIWARRSPNTKYTVISLYQMMVDTRTTTKFNYPDVIKAVNPNPRQTFDSIVSVVFAPDLSHFAFVTKGGVSSGKTGSALWISDMTGSDVRMLKAGAPLMIQKTGASDAQLDDLNRQHSQVNGQKVQYYRSKNGRIYYRDAKTHQAIWVTAAPTDPLSDPATAAPTSTPPDNLGLGFPFTAPEFSPDGQMLAAISNENGKRFLAIINVANGQVHTAALQ